MITHNEPREAGRHPTQKGEYSLRDLAQLVSRGRWTVVATTLLVFGTAALYTHLSRPTFEATARVLVDIRARDASQALVDQVRLASETKMANELEILSSRSLMDEVSQALLRQDTIGKKGRERLPIIAVKDSDGADRKLASVSDVSDRLERAVSFTPIKDSDVIRVTALSTSPWEAAFVANTFAETYARRNVEISRARSRTVREFLQIQVEEKRKTLSDAEQRLQAYQREYGVVTLDDEVKKLVDQLSQLEANRDALNVEISSQTQTLASYRDRLQEEEPKAAKAITESNDSYIRMIQEQLARLEVQRDVIIAQNPQLAGEKVYSEKLSVINDEIAALKTNLRSRTNDYLSSLLPSSRDGESSGGTASFLAGVKQKTIELQVTIDGLVAKRDAINNVILDYEAKFTGLPQKSVDLAKRHRERLSNEKLFLLLEEKYNEAAIKESSEPGYVNIVDRAVVPVKPVSPKVVLNLGLGLLAGLIAGIGLVAVKSTLNTRITSPDDLRRIGYTPVAVISQMKPEGRVNGGRIRGGLSARLLDPRLVTHINPFSPHAESYRHLRTSIEYGRPDSPARKILVTSPNPGEGKSTTAANLAIAFAQAEKRVLLVDADMRRPSLHRLFGLKKEPGLTDLLLQGVPLDKAGNRDLAANVVVLPGGTRPPHPSEIAGSKRMRTFLEEVVSHFDLVILDSPPLLSVTDASVLAPRVDGVLLVVSAGKTRTDALERAIEVLDQLRCELLGIVLNGFAARKAYGKYHGGYGYYGEDTTYFEADRTLSRSRSGR